MLIVISLYFIEGETEIQIDARTSSGFPSQSVGLGLENRPLCGSDSGLAILATDNSAKLKRVLPLSPQAAIQNGLHRGWDLSPHFTDEKSGTQ